METFTGRSLLSAMMNAQAALTLHQHTINQINVFPVPDGDTGTNMLATLTAGLNGIDDSCPDHLGQFLEIFGRGCFWGARGNSGVLLSQFIQGLYRHLMNYDTCTTKDMVEALKAGHLTAYDSMHQPVEGTMLSLMKSISLAFELFSAPPSDLKSFWQHIVDTSKTHVDDTPNQMPLLAQSGVVDSGALGLLVIFLGIWAHYADELLDSVPIQIDNAFQSSLPVHDINNSERLSDWGFCTQFVISNGNTSPQGLRTLLSPLGDSILTTEFDSSVKLHIHTAMPQEVIRTALRSGHLTGLMIQNMDDHQSLQEAPIPETGKEQTSCLISITDDGFADVFEESGLAFNIHTETDDPRFLSSLAQVIERTLCANIILMATSVPQSQLVQYLDESSICGRTIRTLIFPNPVHAIAAALAFNPYQTTSANIKRMSLQASDTFCISIHSTDTSRLSIYDSQSRNQLQYISTIEGNEVSRHSEIPALIEASLPDLEAYLDPIITIYRGAHVSETDANDLFMELERKYPNTSISMLFANQSNSLYLVSLE